MGRKVELHPSGQASIYHSNVRRHSRKVFEEFAECFAVYFAWGNGPTGDHAAGRAIDLMAYGRGNFSTKDHGTIREGWNAKVAGYAWKHRKRLGIWYIIYDQLIISTNPKSTYYGEWSHYTGKSHADHVHISLWKDNPTYRPPRREGKDWLDMASKGDVRKLVREVIREEVGKAVWRHRLDAPKGDLGYSQDTYQAQSFLRGGDAQARRNRRIIPRRVWRVAEILNKSNDKNRSAASTLSDIEDSQETFEKRTQSRFDSLLSLLNEEELDGLAETLAAWQDPGESAEIHREAQDKLAEDWPTLYEALVELAGPPVEVDDDGGF